MSDNDDAGMGTDATIDPSQLPGASRQSSATVVGHGDAKQAPVASAATVSVTPAATPPIKTPVIRAGQRDYPELLQIERSHYVIGDELARGGMGRIMVARDRRLGRQVAIKELLSASSDLRVRFEREARITAQLQHPAIVNILEAGTWATGEPFYVMKLVAGKSLEKAIAERDTFAKRLELLPHALTVVDALAYAHSKRVIHRDLKPANVLVGDFGETVVIDWGLAKDLGAPASEAPIADAYRGGADGQTVAGSIMGTPAYMPAEQATGGDVDERSDVYALGAILYHLLTGKPPYTGKTTDAILDAVVKGPPKPIHTLAPDVPADLVTIVDKAMASKAKDRYATAGELADDLRRFHTGQLVGAHRYTRRERLRRLVRRYRVPLAVAAVALVVLAIGTGVSVRRIVAERDAAEVARGEALAQSQLAEDRRKRADTERGAAEDLVGFMMAELKPKVARLGRLELMGGVGKQVDDYYSKVTSVQALDATATERRAEALATLGDVLDDAGDVKGARRQFEAAIAIAKTPEVRAQAQVGLVIALEEQGDLAGALAQTDAAIAKLTTETKSPGVDLAIGRLERQHGIILFAQGKHADAITAYGRAIDRDLAVIAVKPADRDARAELAKSYDRRTDARVSTGDFNSALADARSGLALRQQLQREDAGDVSVQVGLVVSWGKMFMVARGSNKLADAKAAAEQEMATAEQLVRIDPSNAQWAHMLLTAAQRGPDLAYENDDYAGAAAGVERPLALAQAAVERAPDSQQALESLEDILQQASNYQTFANKPELALETAKKAIAIAEQLRAKYPDNVRYARTIGIAHERAGDAYSKRNDIPHAADEYSARVAAEKDLVASDPDNVRTVIDLAWSQVLAGRAIAMLPGRYDEGLNEIKTAIATMEGLEKAGTITPQGREMIPMFKQQLDLATKKTPFT